MNIELKVQKDSVNTLKGEILSHSNSKLKKIYVITSEIKESGYDIIEECLIDLKAKKIIAFGIDKKNTTKKMLDNVLKYTKNVYIWDNNGEIEFSANIFVFEYEDEAFVYLLNGDLTDSLLETDLAMYTKISYDLIKDKKEYEDYINTMARDIKESFVKLTREYINELLEQKLIFTTKQYIHTLPSISELLGKTEKEENIVQDIKPKEIPKIELNDIDIDAFEIDLSELENAYDDIPTEEIEEANISYAQQMYEEIEDDIITSEEMEEANRSYAQQMYEELKDELELEESEEECEISSEAIDMEALVLESKVIKIDRDTIEQSKKKEKQEIKEEKQVSKKINLSKVTNIIMEISAKPTKGKDVNKIKIPNYIKDMIPQFFEIMEDAVHIKNEDGEYKETDIKLEVIDVSNGMKYVDSSAKLRQKIGQTYIEFESEKLIDIMYEEFDIARVIKLARDSYHIEIIPQGIEEYSLWDKMCTNDFRGSNRQYGLM